MRLLLLLTAGCAMGGAMHQATLSAGDKHAQPPLAIGAHFRPELATEIPGTSTPHLVLESADPAILQLDADGRLVAKAPGAAAVLMSTDDGAVIDFVHVWVAPVTSISLARKDGDTVAGEVGLAVGEDLTVVPALYNGAQKLSGEAETTWTQTGDAVVVMRDGTADRRRLRARAPGKSTITVAMGDAHTTFDIEVLP